MIKKTNIILLLIAMVLSNNMFASSKIIKTDAWGEAYIQDDVLSAKEQALQASLKNAVAQALGTKIYAKSSSKNFALISAAVTSKTEGYVSRYKIKKQKIDKENNIIKIKVRAYIDKTQLQKKFDNIKALIETAEKPVIAVSINNAGKAKNNVYLAKIAEALRGKSGNNFPVVGVNYNADLDKMLESASKKYADILLVAEYRDEIPDITLGGMSAVISTLGIKAYSVDSRDMIYPQKYFTQKATAILKQELLSQGAAGAVNQAMSDFIPRILSYLAKGTRTYKLVFRGKSMTYKYATAYKDKIEQIPFVKKVYMRYYGGSAEQVYSVETSESLSDLLASLKSNISSRWKIAQASLLKAVLVYKAKK